MPAFEGPAVWAALVVFFIMVVVFLYFLLQPEGGKTIKATTHAHHRIGETLYRHETDNSLGDKKVRSFWTQRPYNQMSQYVLLVTDVNSGRSLSRSVDGPNAYVSAEEQMHQNLVSLGYEIEGERLTLDHAIDPEIKATTGAVIHKERDRDDDNGELVRIFG